MHSKILSEPPLVGREKELAQLELHLKHALEGEGLTIFVSGEAGTGKTRLIETFLERAKKGKVTVLSGWCLSEVTAPYLPFIEAFNSYKAPSSETGSINLEKLQKPNGLSPQIWKNQVFAAVVDSLRSISSKEPVILFIDDIQWADSASLALLHYVARAVKNSERVMVVGTVRIDELTSDAEGHPHPLAEVVRMMRREDLITEVKLSNLNNADVVKIAEELVGGSLQSQLAEKLAAESKGNPLFIVESLRMLHERQALKFENNQWHLSTTEFGLPTKIKDIILRRLSALNYSQRRVLDAAAVIGEKFDIELLSSVLEADVLEVLETLNMVAHTTCLVSVEENCYKFDHERSRETLYQELASPLKQGYHARIAEKLESSQSATLPLSDLAFHYAQAGKNEKAIKYALAAAKDELSRFSNQQAIQHFKYVLQKTQEEFTEQRNSALEGLGDAYAANSMYGEAIKTFNELAASDTGLIRLRALRKAMDAAFHKGDKPDLLIEYAKKAEKLAKYDRLEMGRVLNNRGRAFGYAGRGNPKQDLADYNAALKIFEEENSLADIGSALWRSGVITAGFEGLEEGLNRLLRSIAIFNEIGDSRKEAVAILGAGQIFLGVGVFSEAERKFAAVHVIGEKLGMFPELMAASRGLSFLYELDGNLREALSESLKSIEYSKKTDAIPFDLDQLASLVRLYCKLGELDHAEDSYKIMMKTAPKVLNRLRKIGGGAFNPINITKAVYLAAKGRFEEANNVFENHLKSYKSSFPVAGYEVRSREKYAWVLKKQGKDEEAEAQIEKAKIALKRVIGRLEQANVQLNVTVPRQVQVDETFEIRLDIVNVCRSPSELVRIKGIAHSELRVVGLPSFCTQQNSDIDLKDKSVGPFQVVTVKLKVEAPKEGIYTLNLGVSYVDDLGQTTTSVAKEIAVTAKPEEPDFDVLPGRRTTGLRVLDGLLLGGMPDNYAIALSGSPSNEREIVISKFLEAGTKNDEIVFYVTTEADNLENLLANPDFHLFLCNPRPKTKVPDLPNVHKLRSKTDLTNLSISLVKAYRNLEPSKKKRILLGTVSNVLLNYEAKATCKWISELSTDLTSKGFTILAVMDPKMHPPDQANAVLNLFDGEIEIIQPEDPLECKKAIRVKRLRNKEYVKNQTCLTT